MVWQCYEYLLMYFITIVLQTNNRLCLTNMKIVLHTTMIIGNTKCFSYDAVALLVVQWDRVESNVQITWWSSWCDWCPSHMIWSVGHMHEEGTSLFPSKWPAQGPREASCFATPWSFKKLRHQPAMPCSALVSATVSLLGDEPQSILLCSSCL